MPSRFPWTARKTREQGKIRGVQQLTRLIRNYQSFRGRFASDFKLLMGDSRYYLPPIEDVRRILAANSVSRRRYMPQKYDCDDFTISLKNDFNLDAYRNGRRRYPYSVGMIFGELKEGPHAINIVITNREQILLIEPQNDSIFQIRKEDRKIFFIYF